MLSKEIWADIPGYQNFYKISNFGRVLRVGSKILKPNLSSNGYLRVNLCVKNMRQEYMIHRLVAMSFLGAKPFDGAEVRHLDDNKHNNVLSNIRWGTRSQNMKDRVANGVSNRGSRNGHSKLRECCVKAIKELLKNSVSASQIAKTFDVSRVTIVDIKTGRTWKHLGE